MTLFKVKKKCYAGGLVSFPCKEKIISKKERRDQRTKERKREEEVRREKRRLFSL
jgi:hypothetical protein